MDGSLPYLNNLMLCRNKLVCFVIDRRLYWIIQIYYCDIFTKVFTLKILQSLNKQDRIKFTVKVTCSMRAWFQTFLLNEMILHTNELTSQIIIQLCFRPRACTIKHATTVIHAVAQ
jgi:hypothetical protein